MTRHDRRDRPESESLVSFGQFLDSEEHLEVERVWECRSIGHAIRKGFSVNMQLRGGGYGSAGGWIGRGKETMKVMMSSKLHKDITHTHTHTHLRPGFCSFFGG